MSLGWGVGLDPESFNGFVLVSAIIFPLINLMVRARKRLKTSIGRVVLMITLGATAPTSLFLAFSIIQPELLTKISDKNILLGVSGLIGLALIIYQLFELED